MAQLDMLVSDIAGRFNLGASAGSWVQEILRMITGSPGGIGGFLDRFKSAGLGSEVKSWLGHPDAAPLPANQVDRALGSNTLSKMAAKLGMGASAVSMMAGYTIPKLIGALTPGGIIPSNLSADVMGFLSSSREQVPPLHVDVIADEVPESTGRWIWPLLSALAALLLGFYIFSNRATVSPPVARTPVVQTAAALPSWLTLTNDNGVIRYSGTVHDEATRTSVLNALTAAFGVSNIQGDIGIDPTRSSAPWSPNLRAAFDNLKIPGVQAAFEGNALNIGGVSETDRNRIFASMKNIFGSTLSLGALDDVVASANSKVLSALSALQAGFSTSDLTGILNQSIVNFSSGESQVPSAAMGFLQNAATQIKKLPSNTVLEISGYTDNVGDQAANVALSQRRADAVRSELIRFGVVPSMLMAKGYGDAKPVASNDSAEGRFLNRRIEYHVITP